MVFIPTQDADRFDRLCRYLLASVLTPGLKSSQSYVAVATTTSLANPWIYQQRKLLRHCSSYLKHMRPEVSADHRSMMLYLNMLLTFTNPQALAPRVEARSAMLGLTNKTLHDLVSRGLLSCLQLLLKKFLCRSRPCLSSTQLSAVMTIALRPSRLLGKEEFVTLCLLHILSVPALTLHLQNLAPESLTLLIKSCSIRDVSSVLRFESDCNDILSKLGGNYTLSLLANIIHLSSCEMQAVQSAPLEFAVCDPLFCV